MERQIDNFYQEQKVKILNHGGLRRRRKFDKIIKQRMDELSKNKQEYIKLSPNTFENHLNKTSISILEESAQYFTDNFMIKRSNSSKKVGKFKNRKQDGSEESDPYANKKMEYRTDYHLNYQPADEDLYIYTDQYPPVKLYYGEPLKMSPGEEQFWQRFLKYIDDNGLEPLDESSNNHLRIGYGILVLQ